MAAARGAAGYKLGFAVEDDDKAASVGLEAGVNPVNPVN